MARRGRHAMDAFADDDDFAADAPPAPIGHRKHRRIAPIWIILSIVAVAAVVIAVVAFGSSSPDPAPAPSGAGSTRPVRGSCAPQSGPSLGPSLGPLPAFVCVLYTEETIAFNSGSPTVRATADGGDVAFRPAADIVYYYQHGTATSLTAADCTSQDQPLDVANLSDLAPGFLACRVEPFGAVSYVEVADASQVTATDPRLSLRVTFVPTVVGPATPTPTRS